MNIIERRIDHSLDLRIPQMNSVGKEQIRVDVLQQFRIQLPVFGDERRQGGLRRVVEEGIALRLQPHERRLYLRGVHHHIRRHIRMCADKVTAHDGNVNAVYPRLNQSGKQRQNSVFFRIRSVIEVRLGTSRAFFLCMRFELECEKVMCGKIIVYLYNE